MRGLGERIRRRLRPPTPRPIILMYHRIAHPPVDPWGLAVRPDHFEAHLGVLRRSREPLSMSDFVDNLDRGTLPNAAVAVTFDDGYADNLRAARPRLEGAGVPATLFLTTGAVGQPTEYWWDELARGILRRAEALDQEVVIGTERCRLAFGPVALESGRRSAWRAWEDPPGDREAAYLATWRRLRDLSAVDRGAAMSRLREVLGAPPPDPADLPMNANEVAELTSCGLFEIGGHTVTHPALPTLDATERRREILEGKRACERLVSRSISGFAYPHGALDADSRAAVQECGFSWACSTEACPVSGDHIDRYGLPRKPVFDWDGEAFEQALQSTYA